MPQMSRDTPGAAATARPGARREPAPERVRAEEPRDVFAEVRLFAKAPFLRLVLRLRGA